MRVPQSPKSLRRVMTVSSVRSEDDDGASSTSSGDETSTKSSGSTFKKSRPNESATRPPRPTYTAKYGRDGKFTVGVEATLVPGTEDASTKNDKNNNINDDSVKNANDVDAKKLLDGAALPASFHRSRERTRISAVQRLVERKLAQKERERLRERELERDRLSHGKARSSSSNNSCYVRERSWDATYHSSWEAAAFLHLAIAKMRSSCTNLGQKKKMNILPVSCGERRGVVRGLEGEVRKVMARRKWPRPSSR